MPQYWIISDHDRGAGGIGTGRGMNNGGLTYWVSEGQNHQLRNSLDSVRNELVAASSFSNFPRSTRRIFTIGYTSTL